MRSFIGQELPHQPETERRANHLSSSKKQPSFLKLSSLDHDLGEWQSSQMKVVESCVSGVFQCASNQLCMHSHRQVPCVLETVQLNATLPFLSQFALPGFHIIYD